MHYYKSETFKCKNNPCMKQLLCQIKLANCPVKQKCKPATALAVVFYRYCMTVL